MLIYTQRENTTQHTHNTTQHNTTQHNTTQHNTTQHNTTQHNTTHTATVCCFILLFKLGAEMGVMTLHHWNACASLSDPFTTSDFTRVSVCL